jgi:N utilization substance protein B
VLSFSKLRTKLIRDNAKMAKRSHAREVAFQVIYQDDLNPRSNPAHADAFIADRIAAEGLVEFAKSLVAGARRNRPQIDAALNETADNWNLDRMAATDRNILRLAAYELLHTDTPRAVAIDEAIELAKRFGSAQSAQFVNGILDRLVPPDADKAGTGKPEA